MMKREVLIDKLRYQLHSNLKSKEMNGLKGSIKNLLPSWQVTMRDKDTNNPINTERSSRNSDLNAKYLHNLSYIYLILILSQLQFIVLFLIIINNEKISVEQNSIKKSNNIKVKNDRGKFNTKNKFKLVLLSL